MDITEIIDHQHAEQRRMFGVLEQWPREDTEGLAAVWRRLAILLETHAEAEERYFYPELLKLGTGAGDAASTDDEILDAVKDHNLIREAVRRVNATEPGSQEWWTAVVDANVHNSDHMGEEERQDLADFRQQASLEVRHRIAVAFLRFESLKAATGITPEDKDPRSYLRGAKAQPTSALAEEAAADARKAAGPDQRVSEEASKVSSPSLQEDD